VPSLFFLDLNAIALQQKWRVEVGPHRVAVEVRAMLRPPSYAQTVTDESISLKDYSATTEPSDFSIARRSGVKDVR
jgi:hypothetical protein